MPLRRLFALHASNLHLTTPFADGRFTVWQATKLLLSVEINQSSICDDTKPLIDLMPPSLSLMSAIVRYLNKHGMIQSATLVGKEWETCHQKKRHRVSDLELINLSTSACTCELDELVCCHDHSGTATTICQVDKKRKKGIG